MKSWLEDARKTSGLSPEDCSSAMGCSRNTYRNREIEPGQLSLDEVRALRGVFNKDSRKILWSALSEFKP